MSRASASLERMTRPALVAGAVVASAILAAQVAKRRRAIDFRDRVVAISGGSRGLGLLLARELARQGARIALLARDPQELDASRYELMACHDAEVITVPCDVRDRDDAAWAISRVVSKMGGLDVLINNAGVIQVGPVDHMLLDDFEEAMAVHLWGPLYLTLAALPHLKARKGGRIVNIASIGGKVAVPHLLPYSVSKFALVGLSNGLSVELARQGIRVTTVCPGLMRTGSHVNALFKGKRRRELAWFAIADATPLSSMDGRRAARRILTACRYGDPHLILTGSARAAAVAASLFPNLTTRALRLVNRLLPKAERTGAGGEAGNESQPGWRNGSLWVPSILTRLADRAAVENNELRGNADRYWKKGLDPSPADEPQAPPAS